MLIKSTLASLSLASLTVAVCVAATAASAGSPRCESARDAVALKARAVQTELMVGALSCGDQQRYNSFVRTFRGQIIAQGSSLRALFERAYGGGGKRKLNDFVTRLANDAAMRSANSKDTFCASARLLMSTALATPPGNFETMVQTAAPRIRHDFAGCR